MNLKATKKGIDWTILVFALGFVILGLVMIGDISLIEAEMNFGDKFYFLKRQLTWALLGGVSLFLTSQLNYHFLKKLSRIIFILALILLALIFVPGMGISAYGAKRWINLGFINFQPVELIKLSSIIYFSSLLTQKERRPFWQQLFILSVPVLLILLEPDFGSTVLLVSLVGLLWFLSGENLVQLFSIAIIGLVAGGFLILASPYRKQRVLGLLDPFYDPQGKSYHVYQLVLTLGSGGWSGRGMGNSRQKYRYLPEATTDSIIALIAEEFGFLGIALFLFLFAFFIKRCFQIANSVPDPFGQLLASGITGLIAIQGIINLGAVAVIFPLTGMPFPFVSYGGSSLITLMAATGILLNISRYRKPR